MWCIIQLISECWFENGFEKNVGMMYKSDYGKTQ